MDIDRIGQRQNDPAVTGQSATRRTDRAAGNAQPKPDAGSNVQPQGDTVEISDHSRALSKAHQAVNAAPDVRADKVAEIKKRIEDGTYSVSPEMLARKMLGLPDESA